MKKSLIALAVAGAFAAPAFAATSNVDVYGVMNIAIQDTDFANTDMDVVDNVSRIGFKGSEDLGGGLKAIWQIEQGINATGPADGVSQTGGNTTAGDGDNTFTSSGGAFGGAGLRNTFIGLSGGFGTAVIGRHDTPYKMATGKYDIFGDTIGDYNTGRTDGVQLIDNTHDARANNAIAYISPNFSGFTVAAAVVTSMDQLNPATGADTVDAISLAAMYANGPLTVDVAYQDVDAVASGSAAWKIGAGYSFGDAKVGFVWEDIENDDNTERDSWLINGSYSLGAIALKAQYGDVDLNGVDQNAWALGLDYNLSKRTTAYFVYANGDNDAGDDVSGWNLGVKHSF